MEVFQPIANFCKFNRTFFDSLSLLLGPLSDVSSSSLHSNSKSISSTPRTSTIISNPGDHTKRSFSNRNSLLERPSNQRRERTSSNPEKPFSINLNRPQPSPSQLNPAANNNNNQNKGINYLYATELPAEPTTRSSIRQQKNLLYSPRGDSPHQLFKSSITTSVISAETSNSTPKSSMDSSSLNSFSGIGPSKTNIKARRVLRVSNEHAKSVATAAATTHHSTQHDQHKTSFTLNNHNRTSSNNPNTQQQTNQLNNEVSYHVQISNEQQQLLQQPTTRNRSSNTNLRVVKRTTPRDNSEKQQRTILKEIHRFLEANTVAKPNINQFKQFSFNKLTLSLKPDLTPKNNPNRSISPSQIIACLQPDSTAHVPNNQKRIPQQDQLENNENSIKIRSNACAQQSSSSSAAAPSSSVSNQENHVSSFMKYCQKQSLASNAQPHFRGNSSQFPESKVLNQERNTQDNFSVLETANSVASKVTSEESKGRVISSFCRFSSSNIESEAQNTSPKKSIESVDKIYGSKNLLNSFRAQNNTNSTSSQPQQESNPTNQGSGYDQSARLHRCMDEDFSLPSNRQQQQPKKQAINSRYTSTETNKSKHSKQLNQPKQAKSPMLIHKPPFIETFIHRHTKDFANSLAKRINSKLNFLTECINIQLEQEGVLYNALLSDGNSSTDSRDSDIDDSIII